MVKMRKKREVAIFFSLRGRSKVFYLGNSAAEDITGTNPFCRYYRILFYGAR